MVYVLAAYSITISVLSIYGVLLQHRARIARARGRLVRAAGPAGGPAAAAGTSAASGTTAAAGSVGTTAELAKGFNLGAALLAPIWAWAHGLRAAGAALLAACAALVLAEARGLRVVVLVLGALLLGAALFLGVAGNRIAAARAGNADPAGFFAVQLRWAIAGAVLHTLVLPWACYFWLADA